MQDNIFIDTNIVVYAYSRSEKEKKIIAQNIIVNYSTVVSTQVLQEMTNILHKKFNINYSDIEKVLNECTDNINVVYANTAQTVLRACRIAERYQYSFYDSLIIASALESGCNKLFSEDMQDKQIIENVLQIINPFNRNY